MPTMSIGQVKEIFMKEENYPQSKFYKYNNDGELIEISLEEYEKGLTVEELETTMRISEDHLQNGKFDTAENVFRRIFNRLDEKLQNNNN